MSFFQQVRKQVLSSISFTDLMRIDGVRIEKKAGGYVADGEVLNPFTYENTGEFLERVPISVPVIDGSGAGIFGMAARNQCAIVQYLQGSKALPIITGFWTDEYTPACDDAAALSIHSGNGTTRIANTRASLCSILKNVLIALKQLKTQGGPSNQVISPDTIAALEAEQQKLEQLLIE